MTVETPPVDEPDLQLLHRFIESGDPAVFAEIVQRYARVVYAASLRVLGDDGRAQDVSQETFFRLMQRPKLVTHSLAGWLHRTATHVALDVRRSEYSRRQREQTYGLEKQNSRSARDSWGEVSPFVDQALNEIEEPSRSLLIRHFLQGIPQAELAMELDVSPATLSRRIKSGLEILQTNLQKRGIYVGVAVLAGFCTSHAQASVPVALVSEMGKMKMIAMIRQLPAGPVPPRGPFHPPSRITYNPTVTVPAKYAVAVLGIVVVLAAYAFMTASSWLNADQRTFVVHHSEP